jgi:hypothetical protein
MAKIPQEYEAVIARFGFGKYEEIKRKYPPLRNFGYGYFNAAQHVVLLAWAGGFVVEKYFPVPGENPVVAKGRYKTLERKLTQALGVPIGPHDYPLIYKLRVGVYNQSGDGSSVYSLIKYGTPLFFSPGFVKLFPQAEAELAKLTGKERLALTYRLSNGEAYYGSYFDFGAKRPRLKPYPQAPVAQRVLARLIPVL